MLMSTQGIESKSSTTFIENSPPGGDVDAERKAALERLRSGQGAGLVPMQVVDLFSGAGGMSAGLEAAGAEVLLGVDINEASAATFSRNHEGRGLVRDVRAYLTGENSLVEDIAQTGAELDLDRTILVACAPCQGFSAHRKKHKGREDGRNSLVAAVAEVAATFSPAYVVMENVPELLTGKFRGHYEAFRDRMVAAGYRVVADIVSAADYGVAQARHRAIVIASRVSEPSLPLRWLGPDNYQTVRDAIADLPPVVAGEVDGIDSMHRSARHRSSTLEVIRAVPHDGGSRPRGIGPKCLDKVNGFSDVYGRLAWDRPAITITHYARNPASGRYIHPAQDRGLTAREAARLQGFPDRYEFVGGFDDVFRQIGEAVPPPVGVAIGLHLSKQMRRNGPVS